MEPNTAAANEASEPVSFALCLLLIHLAFMMFEQLQKIQNEIVKQRRFRMLSKFDFIALNKIC